MSLHLIEISRPSKVEHHSLLDQKFVLLCRRLHLDQRRKVRRKITCLLGGQGERVKKENVSNKPEFLVLFPAVLPGTAVSRLRRQSFIHCPSKSSAWKVGDGELRDPFLSSETFLIGKV